MIVSGGGKIEAWTRSPNDETIKRECATVQEAFRIEAGRAEEPSLSELLARDALRPLWERYARELEGAMGGMPGVPQWAAALILEFCWDDDADAAGKVQAALAGYCGLTVNELVARANLINLVLGLLDLAEQGYHPLDFLEEGS